MERLFLSSSSRIFLLTASDLVRSGFAQPPLRRGFELLLKGNVIVIICT